MGQFTEGEVSINDHSLVVTASNNDYDQEYEVIDDYDHTRHPVVTNGSDDLTLTDDSALTECPVYENSY